jgi:hypothetical protein
MDDNSPRFRVFGARLNAVGRGREARQSGQGSHYFLLLTMSAQAYAALALRVAIFVGESRCALSFMFAPPLAFALIFVGSSAAFADCHGGTNLSGSDQYAFGGSGQHQASEIWTTSNKHLSLTDVVENLSAGRAGDVWFDWSLCSDCGHMDSRVVRNYYNYSTRSSGTFTDAGTTDTRYVHGIAKEAGCVWDTSGIGSFVDADPVPGQGGCAQGPSRAPSCPVNDGAVNPRLNSDNKSTEWWLRNGSGQDSHFDGGDPFDAYA